MALIMASKKNEMLTNTIIKICNYTQIFNDFGQKIIIKLCV